ncbi:MAG: hypothetical protein WC802_02395 [Patescibacteria group bacterium]|jgi:hypothetical protein
MNLLDTQYGRGPRRETEPEARRSRFPRWQSAERLNEIWQEAPDSLGAFDKVVDRPIVSSALEQAKGLSREELALRLADGLRSAFLALGEDAPETLNDLDDRAKLAERSGVLTGTARDYLAQRLMAISGPLQFLDRGMKISPSQEAFLRKEADRLAVFLTALEREEHVEPAQESLAAK